MATRKKHGEKTKRKRSEKAAKETKKKTKSATKKRRPPSKDPVLADAIVAFGLHALLSGSGKRAVTRLRKKGADRQRVLAEALAQILPPDLMPHLLISEGVEARGDWLGVYIGIDHRLHLIRSLLERHRLGESRVGVALVWRLAFFELAVRIACASFSRAPDETPELRQDLWANEDGFGIYLRSMMKRLGITRKQLVDVMFTRRIAGDNVEKSQIERWLYEHRRPQADSLHALARGLAIAAAGEEDAARVATLRLQLHLFAGCRAGFDAVSELLGMERASTLAAVFSKQVHVTVQALSRRARAKAVSSDGRAIDPDQWLKERRWLARSAALFGIAGGSISAHLLYDLGDADLRMLVSPETSPFFENPHELFSNALEKFNPKVAEVQRALIRVVRSLSIDDVVSDASQGNNGRQPLGILGLVERVLKMRLPL